MSAAGARLQPRPRIQIGDYPVDAAWSADGRALLVAGGDGALCLLATDTGAAARAIGRHEGGVLAVAWQAGGRLFASSGQDGLVRLWDALTLQSTPLSSGKQWSERLAFSDNGRLLAVATGRSLAIFDAQGAPQAALAAHGAVIAAIAWRPRSNEIAALGNGGMQLHRLAPSAATRRYPWPGACLTASWSPDGRVLAAGMQDGNVHCWNVATDDEWQLASPGARVIATGWSASGRHLVAAAGNGVIVWEALKAQQSRPLELQAHSERITALALRPSGNWLVSAARDRRLLLWRLGAAAEPQDAQLLPEECTLLRFSRDGGRLAAGDAAGGVTLYQFAP